MKNRKTCTRCINDSTVKNISFDSQGVCNFCREYEAYEDRFKDYDRLEKIFRKRIKNEGHTYDAAVGFSGGKDSTYVLWKLVKEYGLKVKAFTLDNGFMSEEAKVKIRHVVEELGVEHEFVELDQDLIRRMYREISGKYISPCLCCSFLGYAIMMNYASKVDAAVMIHGRSPYQMLRNFSDGDQDYFKPFITEGLQDEMEDPAVLMEKIIGLIDRYVGKELAAGIKDYFLEDCRTKGFRPFIAYFLYHEYRKDRMIEEISEALDWKVESEEEHFDCLIHHGALYIKNLMARRSHLMPELSVMVREKVITRDEALEMARESCAIPEDLARAELQTFCDYAGLSYRRLMLKARIYSKRWW